MQIFPKIANNQSFYQEILFFGKCIEASAAMQQSGTIQGCVIGFSSIKTWYAMSYGCISPVWSIIWYNIYGNQQLMDDLAVVWISGNQPFLPCVVDYAGFFKTRIFNRWSTNTLKECVYIFVCMVKKAVHLVLVESVEEFLDAFKFFDARRGLCSEIDT